MPRPRKRSETELSKFLDAALKQRGLGHNEFAVLIGMNPATLSDLKLRQETPAPKRAVVHQWAKVLELSKLEEDEFFDLVQLAYSPEYVQDLVASLRPDTRSRRVAESLRDHEPPAK